MSALESEETSLTCTKCEKSKPVADFSRKGDGRRSAQCKECIAAYMRDWSARKKAALEEESPSPEPAKLAPVPKTAPVKAKPTRPARRSGRPPMIPSADVPRIKSRELLEAKPAPATPPPPRARHAPAPEPEAVEIATKPVASSEAVTYVERRIVVRIRIAVEVTSE